MALKLLHDPRLRAQGNDFELACYADDITIMVSAEQLLDTMTIIRNALAEVGLKVQMHKTQLWVPSDITHTSLTRHIKEAMGLAPDAPTDGLTIC
eukprot:3139879-Amphidinium_carterae.1